MAIELKMTTREKLIELIVSTDLGLSCGRKMDAENIADHILASDFINELQNEAYDLGVDSILRHEFGLSWDDAAGLRKEIKRLQDATKWIPVTERLPEQCEAVIVWTSDKELGKAARYGSRFFLSYDDEFANVTHWMPLPEPPEGE